MEVDEHLADGGAQPLVHGETLARPVGGGAEALQLIDDGAAAFGLPFPDARQELLAAHFAPTELLPFHQLALDDHLGGDAGVVGARLPQGVAALHTVIADQDVLERVVERVPDMERPRDVGGRDDDGEAVGARPGPCPGLETARLLPGVVDAALDRGGIIGLFEHRQVQREAARGAEAGALEAVEGSKASRRGSSQLARAKRPAICRRGRCARFPFRRPAPRGMAGFRQATP